VLAFHQLQMELAMSELTLKQSEERIATGDLSEKNSLSLKQRIVAWSAAMLLIAAAGVEGLAANYWPSCGFAGGEFG
jgi:hypothetical protein